MYILNFSFFFYRYFKSRRTSDFIFFFGLYNNFIIFVRSRIFIKQRLNFGRYINYRLKFINNGVWNKNNRCVGSCRSYSWCKNKCWCWCWCWPIILNVYFIFFRAIVFACIFLVFYFFCRLEAWIESIVIILIFVSDLAYNISFCSCKWWVVIIIRRYILSAFVIIVQNFIYFFFV